jgi:hypothetical protein
MTREDKLAKLRSMTDAEVVVGLRLIAQDAQNAFGGSYFLHKESVVTLEDVADINGEAARRLDALTRARP